MTGDELAMLARRSYTRAIALGECPSVALRVAVTDARVVGQEQLEVELAEIRRGLGRHLEVVS